MDAIPSLMGQLRHLCESGLGMVAKHSWPHLARYLERSPRPATRPTWAPPDCSRDLGGPPLGWPRTTDSLCPECVKQLRQAIADGIEDESRLSNGHPGEIKATIRERDGKLIIEKDCPKHGHFEDLLSIDPAFSRRIESLYFGRDYESHAVDLRKRGSSSIKFGRGAVLTVDLTNRCNMMCDACFMDANQVGYVHELEWPTIAKILNDSLSVLPRRQLSVQFSGGEPTLAPHFLEAVRYARTIGYFCVQCASNGIRFAEDLAFCHSAKAAGLRLCYLQFDGTSNEAHAHRRVSNLFDVKQRAINNLHAAGIDVVLVVTVIRGVNDDEVGRIVQFAIENADKITVVSFQPVSFTGRAEEITVEQRTRQRYTLSHLVYDIAAQTGVTEPLRDWFPLGAMNPLSDLVDALSPQSNRIGALKCGCHPNCGVGTILLVHKETKRMVPLSEFVDIERLLRDIQRIIEARLGKTATICSVCLAVVNCFHADRAPADYRLTDFIAQMISQIGMRGGSVGSSEGDAVKFPWRFLFVAGMWFQDLWTYDFRRTEMCIIPYGTEEGEISFCAYNTGVGFRGIIEKRHASSTTAEWYRKHGRHPVYAKGQAIPLEPEAPAEQAQPRRKLSVLG